METSAITSSMLSQVSGSTPTSNEFVSDLNSLATDLTAGNLSAAQEDYVTLSEDAFNGSTSLTADTSASGITTGLLTDIASSSSSSSAFAGNLNELGNDLQNGDLGSAQQDMLGLDSTALNAAATATPSAAAASSTAATTSANPAEAGMLIQSIVEAMAAGDSSSVSTGMAQLAAVSSSAEGASYLQSLSGSLGSSSGSSSTSPLSQLIASANYSSSCDSSSMLNVLA